MHTVTVMIKHNNPVMSYLDQNMAKSRAVRNTANFLIRNVYTALDKSEDERTDNEKEVLDRVNTYLEVANEKKYQAWLKKKEQGKAAEYKPFSFPDKDHRILSYGQIDAVLKYSKDPAYYGCTSQVNQQAIKKTCNSWKAFFESLKEWKQDPSKFTGRPNIPGYIREKKSTAAFPSGVCRLTVDADGAAVLSLAKYGNIKLGYIPAKEAFVKMEAVPAGRCCLLRLTFEGGAALPEIPSDPKRIMAIDPGVSNFAACTSNTGMTPVLIDGRYIKSVNRFFNKERAELFGILTKGTDPTDRKVRRTSYRMEAGSRNRTEILQDFFYKVSHAICRIAVEEQIELIVFGHNASQKQEVNMGSQNNQNFVQIPYMKFFEILRWTAAKYGIAVDEQEESYTSKADFFAGDYIPTYVKSKRPGTTGEAAKNAEPEEVPEYQFSGRRIKRGLYKSGIGVVINADINGSANILRKRNPNAFEGIDTSYMTGVRTIKYGDLYKLHNPQKRKNSKKENRLEKEKKKNKM